MKFSKLILSLSIIMFIVAVSTAQSQCPPFYTFTGEASEDFFGVSVASAGDVNNDGFDDLIVGAYSNDAGGNNAGRVYVFSGQTGDTLYVFTGEAAEDRFGASVASAGDVNNDGFDDLIVGAFRNNVGGNEAGQAYVFSGQTGDTLYVFTGEAAGDRFGISVASAGDVDNDGFDDLIVGALYNDAGGNDAGRAYVFSGQTGDTLYVFTGAAADDFLGSSVASAGDVNNDGYDDLIVGVSNNDAGGPQAGRAYVFSGQSGETLYVFTGEAEGDLFGGSAASAGDVNNDGFDDLIVGAWGNDAGGSAAGRAYVFSGQSGDTLYVFTGEGTGDVFGYSVASAGDVNNDGFDDLIVGAAHLPGIEAGRVYVFSGQTGETLYVITGEAAGEFFSDLFGYSVASAGDVNNDGFDDLIVGAFRHDAGGVFAGQAYVFSGRPCPCGDANGDLVVDLDDVAFLQAYYFEGAIFPNLLLLSVNDLNCDGGIDIADITYLAAYINGTGAPPCCAE